MVVKEKGIKLKKNISMNNEENIPKVPIFQNGFKGGEQKEVLPSFQELLTSD